MNTDDKDIQSHDAYNPEDAASPRDPLSLFPEDETGLPPEDRLPPAPKNEFHFLHELFDWGESLVTALLVIVLLFSFVVRSIGVEGPSMQETLHSGDYLIVSDLFYEPSPGDVVIVTKKTFSEDSIVKRVIAVGGQTIDMDFDTGEVWVDGKLIDEPYTKETMWTDGNGNFNYPLKVPQGSVFIMGDNRNHSTDSRFSSIGLVDERYIVGHVLFRIWPLNQIGRIA